MQAIRECRQVVQEHFLGVELAKRFLRHGRKDKTRQGLGYEGMDLMFELVCQTKDFCFWFSAFFRVSEVLRLRRVLAASGGSNTACLFPWSSF